VVKRKRERVVKRKRERVVKRKRERVVKRKREWRREYNKMAKLHRKKKSQPPPTVSFPQLIYSSIHPSLSIHPLKKRKRLLC
jgi:hypothetical protein